MSEEKERILEILEDLRGDVDFLEEDALVDDKVLSSFDLVALVVELNTEFDIEITSEDFVEENFNSVDRLEKMVLRLMEQ